MTCWSWCPGQLGLALHSGLSPGFLRPLLKQGPISPTEAPSETDGWLRFVKD